MGEDDIKQLRLEGFLPLKQEGYFSVRIVSEAGKMAAEDMENICYISKKYGQGHINFTTRLYIEIPWIKYEDIDNMKEDIKSFGLLLLKTGQNIPSIISCRGAICTHGVIDAQAIGKNILNKYKDYNLPGKIKIGIVGCPNNCLKVESEDLGVVGQRVPKIIEENCKNCGLCISSCKKSAISILNDKAVLDTSKCINCGKCIENCRFNAIAEEYTGVSIYLGGKLLSLENKVGEINSLYSLEELEEIVDKIMNYYRKHGKRKEK